MITEDQLEQLAIQWFRDIGWNCVHGSVIAPEGVREDRGNMEHRTPNIERRGEEKKRSAEVVGRLKKSKTPLRTDYGDHDSTN